MNIFSSNEKDVPPKEYIGGKAYNLFLLKTKEFTVPNFIVLSSKLINHLLFDVIKINKKELEDIFQNKSQDIALEQLKKVRQKIKDSNISHRIELQLQLAIKDLSSERIILRSSALNEDGDLASFAGIYESKVTNKNTKSILEFLKDILANSFSDRVYLYSSWRDVRQIPKISIIIQEFVEGSVSGVMFTSVKKGEHSGLLINANKGLASSVVQGHHSESYFFPKNKGEKKKSGACLNNQQQLLLVKIGNQIEKFFKKPQDIEWTIKDPKIYILQSRPITAEFSKNVRVWDNSNIAESYSGIVLPLTCSFARDIYKVAYTDLARHSGVSLQKLREYEEVFENLLGFFYGRFYYNILNWYKMLTLFPGYERNKQNLDRMISLKSRAELDEEFIKNVSNIFKLYYYGLVSVKYLTFNKKINKFKEDVKKYYRKVRKINFSEKDSRELLDLYYEITKELLSKWYLTLENDFAAMTFYGMLNKFCGKNKIRKENILRLVSRIHNVISATQIKKLKDLSEKFSQYSELQKLAHGKMYKICHDKIFTDNKYIDLKAEIKNYLQIYGGRFAAELRLESEDMDSNPEYIIRLLVLYSKNVSKNESKRERDVEIKLPIHKKIKLNYIIKNTKKYIKQREELRLLRSQAFSLIRKVFNEIGHRLQTQGVIDNWSDIFYLEIGEVKNYIEGDSTIQSLKDIVSLRKTDYKTYRNIEMELTFITEGSPYSYVSTVNKEFKTKYGELIKGEGCSSGIVKGKVKILKEFQLPDKEKFEIIVTKNTDPGWTPLFGLCKGFIVEQGGLLSHAAIVSREVQMPCVIGVKDATKILNDGQIVTINGFTGEIKLGK